MVGDDAAVVDEGVGIDVVEGAGSVVVVTDVTEVASSTLLLDVTTEEAAEVLDPAFETFESVGVWMPL